MSQSEDIYRYIKQNPGTCTEDIVENTWWNRHLVEIALKLMQSKNMIKKNRPNKKGRLYV